MSASDQAPYAGMPGGPGTQIDGPASHAEGIARLAFLMDLDPHDGTPEAAELDALAASVFAYEERIFPIAPPSPEEARRFREDQEADHGG
jgi:HTH-type transcriptional regulator/antitoxin HigA